MVSFIIISMIVETISHLKLKFRFQQTKPILEHKELVDDLNGLHKKFVTVYIDKASNNVIIVL